MTLAGDDELDLLIARALKARPEPEAPLDLAARACARASKAAAPALTAAVRVRWLRRAQSVAGALAFVVVLIVALHGVRLWSSLSPSGSQETSSTSVSTDSSGELGLVLGLSCVLGAVAVLALERSLSSESEGLAAWRSG